MTRKVHSLDSFAHSRYDVLVVRPGSAQEFGKQSTLSGNDGSAVNDDVELPLPTLFELDGSLQSVMDECSETRCFCCGRTSGLAVDDPDIHSGGSPPCRFHRFIFPLSSLEVAWDRSWLPIIPCADKDLARGGASAIWAKGGSGADSRGKIDAPNRMKSAKPAESGINPNLMLVYHLTPLEPGAAARAELPSTDKEMRWEGVR